jgi:hypothetical protein
VWRVFGPLVYRALDGIKKSMKSGGKHCTSAVKTLVELLAKQGVRSQFVESVIFKPSQGIQEIAEEGEIVETKFAQELLGGWPGSTETNGLECGQNFGQFVAIICVADSDAVTPTSSRALPVGCGIMPLTKLSALPPGIQSIAADALGKAGLEWSQWTQVPGSETIPWPVDVSKRLVLLSGGRYGWLLGEGGGPNRRFSKTAAAQSALRYLAMPALLKLVSKLCRRVK